MECPKCGSSDTGDRWCTGRMLQRHCYDCSWKEAARVPERRVIKATKTILANQFSGFHYEVYDQYGYVAVMSRSYNNREEAKEALIKELTKLNKHPNYAPCTGILWPDRVEVVGEVIKDVP